MKRKKPLSYRNQVRNTYFINGLAWLLTGIISMFNKNMVTKVLTVICLCVGIYALAITLIKSKEKADEMAIANINSAMSLAYLWGTLILLLISLVLNPVISSIFGPDINLTKYIDPAIMAFIGLQSMIVAISFLHLEDN